MSNSKFNDFYIKYELYRHMQTYEDHETKLEIPRYAY